EDGTGTDHRDGGRHRPGRHRPWREAQGGARRPAGRDRRGAGGQRRGVRPQLRPKGRRVSLPLFPPTEDPGPDFASLLQRSGMPLVTSPADAVTVRHATTVVALRFADGVVMAGDRRATEGHSIAHRTMEKVFPADRHSAVAIAGAAGFAVEMVRLFQVQLEHYEKVEGVTLSLEGKANQLAQMVRGQLPLAMQGLAVVPLFCGYDLRRG